MREWHCLPPRRYVESNFKLGAWVSTRRRDLLPLLGRYRICLGLERHHRWEKGFTTLLKFNDGKDTVARRSYLVEIITDLDGGFLRIADVGKYCKRTEGRG